VTRGKAAQVGDIKVSQNGYSYTRTETCWRLTHHLIAEEKLGRGLRADERVEFLDRDRKNLDPHNILVRKRNKGLKHRKKSLELQIQKLQEELALITRRIDERDKLGSQ
jgi:hypothetical protein